MVCLKNFPWVCRRRRNADGYRRLTQDPSGANHQSLSTPPIKPVPSLSLPGLGKGLACDGEGSGDIRRVEHIVALGEMLDHLRC